MKRLVPLALCLLLAGCAAPEHQGERSANTPPAAEQAAPVPEPPLSLVLTSSLGHGARLSLVAPDEQTSLVQDPWCGGLTGDQMRRGHYGVFLQPEGEPARRQEVQMPFGTGPMEFNDKRPQMLTVIPGKVGDQPDLLLIRQHATCNGDLLAPLVLTPDGAAVRLLTFKLPEGEQETLFAGQVETVGPGRFRTQSYNNATGVTTVVTWEVREGKGHVEALSVERVPR